MFDRIQLGDIPIISLCFHRYSETMSPRYSRASELVTFAIRKRAWFLERQAHPIVLIQTRVRRTADHPVPTRAAQQSPATARLSVFPLVLSGIGIACTGLLTWIRR